jgi:soluble lytic murein transglycosylase-like protein
MTYATQLSTLAAFGLLVLGPAALAATPSERPAPPAATKAAPAAPTSKDPFAGARRLSGRDLDKLQGGQNTVTTEVITRQNLSAVNSGNRINATGNVDSGSLSLEANAFAGFNGIGNFVMNTGHNNNLQGSLSVSIVTTPGQ